MKIVRIFCGLALIFCLVFTVFIGKNIISSSGKKLGETTDYQGIITVWQIDTFEGGQGSRKQFLLKASRSFERKNEGVLVMVLDYTLDGAKENFEKGVYPDLVSFGPGVEVKNISEIKSISSFLGGTVGEKNYAEPWCRGGYVLIFNPKLMDSSINSFESILVSQTQYTQPLTALLLEDITVNKVEIKSPLDAYVKFVSGKAPVLLGTQRDLVRLNNRGFEVEIRPLTAYNDLYQYISVTTLDGLKRVYAERFVEHLLSSEVQNLLTDLSMMSVVMNVKFDLEHLNEMQEVSGFKTVSAFTSPQLLLKMQERSLNFLSGDKDAINKIKNMLI